MPKVLTAARVRVSAPNDDEVPFILGIYLGKAWVVGKHQGTDFLENRVFLQAAAQHREMLNPFLCPLPTVFQQAVGKSENGYQTADNYGKVL